MISTLVLNNASLYVMYFIIYFSQASITLLKKIQWQKIILVYTDDSYGVGGYQQLLQAAQDAGICVSAAISVPHDGTVAGHLAKLKDIGSYDVTAAVYYGSSPDAVISLKVKNYVFPIWGKRQNITE